MQFHTLAVSHNNPSKWCVMMCAIPTETKLIKYFNVILIVTKHPSYNLPRVFSSERGAIRKLFPKTTYASRPCKKWTWVGATSRQQYQPFPFARWCLLQQKAQAGGGWGVFKNTNLGTFYESPCALVPYTMLCILSCQATLPPPPHVRHMFYTRLRSYHYD